MTKTQSGSTVEKMVAPRVEAQEVVMISEPGASGVDKCVGRDIQKPLQEEKPIQACTSGTSGK